MSKDAKRHILLRTSPYGEAFVGTCTICNTKNLTTKDLDAVCPNPVEVSFEDALVSLLEILDAKTERRTDNESKD